MPEHSPDKCHEGCGVNCPDSGECWCPCVDCDDGIGGEVENHTSREDQLATEALAEMLYPPHPRD